jgi:hypothetical protein
MPFTRRLGVKLTAIKATVCRPPHFQRLADALHAQGAPLPPDKIRSAHNPFRLLVHLYYRGECA